MRRVVLGFLAVIALGSAVAAASKQQIYHLAIGDPARRAREAPVSLDTIVDTATGDTLTPDQWAARLKNVRLLLIGETHTATEYHRVQLRVIRALHEAGRPVLIGLEMYPYTEQRWLDEWRENTLTEDGFVKLSRWYDSWGYNWKYYRDIFLYAREQSLPMYALNTPREVVSAVRRKGLDNLTPEEAARIPSKIDMDSPDHMTFFRASVRRGRRDARRHVRGGVEGHAGRAGHLGREHGVQRRAGPAEDAGQGRHHGGARRFGPRGLRRGHRAAGSQLVRRGDRFGDPGARAGPGRPARQGRAGVLRQLRLGHRGRKTPTRFPTLGVSTRTLEGPEGLQQVIQVEKDSVASRAGFEVKDVIVSFDGQPLRNRETLNRLMAAKTWGDSATIVVRRSDQDKTLTAYFRRTPSLVPASVAR